MDSLSTTPAPADPSADLLFSDALTEETLPPLAPQPVDSAAASALPTPALTDDSPVPTIGRVFGTEGAPSTRRHCLVAFTDTTGVEEMMFLRIVDPSGAVYYGILEEMAQAMQETRISRAAAVLSEVRGDQLAGAAFTWGTVALIESVPARFAPPAVGSAVMLLPKPEVPAALGYKRLGEPMPFGRLRVGSGETAGPAYLDLDYLFGERGGHCNISGMAGVAAKSSAMTSLLASMRHHIKTARRERKNDRAAELIPIPVVLSVKGDDLMYLDHGNRNFRPDADGAAWRELGLDDPREAYRHARFLAPAGFEDGAGPRSDSLRPTEAFSWSLADVVTNGLFEFLFDDEDMDRQTFQHLLEVLNTALQGMDKKGNTTLRTGYFDDAKNWPVPQSFSALLDFLQRIADGDEMPASVGRGVYPTTVRSFRNRLHKILLQGNGVLSMGPRGNPPQLRDTTARGVDAEGMPYPIVIDITALGAGRRGLASQRFVIAALVKQMETDRLRKDRETGVRYVLFLDELHRFAPHGGADPLTKLLEYIAAEGRSLGILLVGCQQQASLVAAKLIENAALRFVGHTGSGELAANRYGHLSPAMKQLASTLEPGSLIMAFPGLRTPLLIQLPLTPWPMKLGDVGDTPPDRQRPAPGLAETRTGTPEATATGSVRAAIVRGRTDRGMSLG